MTFDMVNEKNLVGVNDNDTLTQMSDLIGVAFPDLPLTVYICV